MSAPGDSLVNKDDVSKNESGETQYESILGNAKPMPVSQPIFIKALKWSLVATVAIAVVMGAIGYFISGEKGLISAAIGAAAAGVFFALTLLSIVIANRLSSSDMYVAMFFGIVMGGWLVKFVLFIVGSLLIKGQPWVEPKILFLSLIIGVIISLVIDSMIIFKSRIPVVSMSDSEI